MRNYLEYADVDLHAGLLKTRVEFTPGLNIISGENGTLKTKLLQALKGQGQTADPSVPFRRQAFSPKRNAQRRAFTQIFEQSRRESRRLDNVVNERGINDNTFEEYPAIGDLYYGVYDDHCRDGGNQIERMDQSAREFNEVISQVFPHYELTAEWDSTNGRPSIELRKHSKTRIPLEGLSLGEQEILALVTNIYASRDRYELFLIDEPEVHLNWHLEERLFDFFDEFCEKFARQMIVVTHSRVIFKQRFYPRSQFLCWTDDGHVEVRRQISAEQRRRIAGDAIEIVRLGEFARPTLFVEDEAQAVVVEAVARYLTVEVNVTPCANKSNVRSLYRLSKREGGWHQSLFLEDGDGEGNPFPDATNFLHLDRYCVECYLFHLPTIALITGRSEREVQGLIWNATVAVRDKILAKNKFLEFLFDRFQATDMTPARIAMLDASMILPGFLKSIGFEYRKYVDAYVSASDSSGGMGNVLPAVLVTAVLRAKADAGATPEEELVASTVAAGTTAG